VVDVIVVSYNSADELRGCVAPLSGHEDIRVLVVDSASQDDSLAVVEDLDVTAIALPENRGFAHACNAGMRASDSDFVLLLNPDARLEPQGVRQLVAVARAAPGTGVVAPRIVEPDGTLDHSLRRYPQLRTRYAQALFLHRLFPRAAWSDEVIRDASVYERAGSFEWASGACLLIPRTTLDALAGLDERFFLYCEDLDLCKRIGDAGLARRYEPTVVATHEGGASAPRAALLPVLAASRVHYALKHAQPAVIVLERLGIVLGSLTHTLVARGGIEARRGHLRSALRALQRRPRPGP
jgi:GT2 family glycosyltransferase